MTIAAILKNWLYKAIKTKETNILGDKFDISPLKVNSAPGDMRIYLHGCRNDGVRQGDVRGTSGVRQGDNDGGRMMLTWNVSISECPANKDVGTM